MGRQDKGAATPPRRDGSSCLMSNGRNVRNSRWEISSTGQHLVSTAQFVEALGDDDVVGQRRVIVV